MPGHYPIDQSPLYRLKSRRKLATLLVVTVAELEDLANEPNYTYFELKKPGKDPRPIQNPSKPLKRIQTRVAGLLGRVAAPPYVHSAYKGTSYILNAQEHLNLGVPSFKIDVKKFFANSDSRRVETLFLKVFECSPDVAAILCKVNTINKHIPTGGSSSTMMSFWAYSDMFKDIDSLAASHGVKMTLCVDDMTFSGASATRSLRYAVEKIIKQYGLRPHKRHHTRAGSPKIITGVAVTAQGIRLPNKRRLQLHDSHKQVDAETDVVKKFRLAQQLLGRATEAAQIEPRFQGDIIRANKKLRESIDQAELAGFVLDKGQLKVRP
jgi:RNA-directed DNA polymerase